MAGFGAAPFGTSPFGTGAATAQSISPAGLGSGEAFGSPLVALNSGTFGITLFPAGREGFLDATISWSTAVIKAALVRSYAINVVHRFVSDVTGTGGQLVATAPSTGLASKTTLGGVADAEDIVFPSVAAGPLITMLVLFQASAVTGGADVAATAQRLIGYVDSSTGLPVVPTGTDIAVTWSNDRTRIFML